MEELDLKLRRTTLNDEDNGGCGPSDFRRRNASLLGRATLGLSTFCAAHHPVESCGSNGLPLTPNSIHILGRFHTLSQLRHPNLCSYAEIFRIQHERLIVVAEQYGTSLQSLVQQKKTFGLDLLRHVARCVFEALAHLHSRGVVHRNLHLKNVLVTPDGCVKLSCYGMYFMTKCGTLVSFPIGYPKNLAPEVLLLGCGGPADGATVGDEELALRASQPKSDVWSTGLLLLELALGVELLSEARTKLCTTLRRVMSWIHAERSAVQRIVHDADAVERWKSVHPDLKEVIESCLRVSPGERPTAGQVLQRRLFSDAETPAAGGANFKFAAPVLAPELQRVHRLVARRPLDEVCHLWHLVGGDVEAELRRAAILRNKPAVFCLPCVVLEEGESFGQTKDRTTLWDDAVVDIGLEGLLRRLQLLPPTVFDPPLDDKSRVLLNISDHPTLNEAANLPLIIKEKDIEYQLYRIILFDKLLQSYPLSRPSIVKEAREDIPPLYRGRVWAALLKVDPSYRSTYAAIDKESSHSCDRQIEVDIPRCHQYVDLLTSPDGHAKFKRVLKAWISQNEQYVYWQGLDSLTAPFLLLHFHDEALAYACLSAFVPKYLHSFFWKDNSAVIQEYLAKFSHLIAFHDPVLRNHLDSIGFVPDLYAIPWFLTMFAHVFPLHKIFHLWDKLLLGNASFPLCVGLAVLQQLRDTLLESGFNECILLFSDMPEIDMERCVKDSIDIFCSTPASVTYRQHEPPSTSPHRKRALWDWSLVGASLSHGGGGGGEDGDAGLAMDAASPLDMEPLPLAQLRAERCPQISAEDLIELLDLNGTKFARPKIVVVDVRSAVKFHRGTVPGGLNLPYLTAWTDDGTLVACDAVDRLQRWRGRVVCVLGSSRNDLAQRLAEILLQRNWPRVCTLNRGFDVLLKTQILVVPAAVGMC